MCSLSLRSQYPDIGSLNNMNSIRPMQASATPAPAVTQLDMTMLSQAMMTATFWGAVLAATPAILTGAGVAASAFNSYREKDSEKKEAKIAAQQQRIESQRRRQEAAIQAQREAAERERLVRLKMEEAERERQYELSRMAWENDRLKYGQFQSQPQPYTQSYTQSYVPPVQQYIAPPQQSNLPTLRRSGNSYYNY